MKDLAILILVLLVLFFVWNGRQKSTYAAGDVVLDAPVPPLIVQSIIEKIQSMKENLVPIDTVFVNLQPDGSYLTRILFYNTKYFFGTQYDIRAQVGTDGSVNILNIGDSAQVDINIGYKPDKYQEWSDVQKNLDDQLSGALKGYKNQPPQPNLSNPSGAYSQGMIETRQNLQTRS